jgi:hypothetical protein
MWRFQGKSWTLKAPIGEEEEDICAEEEKEEEPPIFFEAGPGFALRSL